MLASGLFDSLVRPDCALCGARAAPRAGATALCERCRAHLPCQRGPACAVCAIGVSAGEQCGRCLAGEPAFDATVAAFRYEFPLDELIKALKFSARLDLAAELAAPLARALAARGETFDAILAVPLSRQRLALRGFDQAEVIADALARTLDAPRLRGVLAKTRDTPPQAGLERAARLRNVRGAYELRAGAHLAGLRIALVDDVMTTGATLREAARVLKAGAAARVTACVLARAGDDLGGDPRADAAIS